MPDDPKTSTIFARVPDSTREQLEALAETDERDLSHLVRTAITQYLNRRKKVQS